MDTTVVFANSFLVGGLMENIDYWKYAPVWDKNKIKKATKNWFKYLS